MKRAGCIGNRHGNASDLLFGMESLNAGGHHCVSEYREGGFTTAIAMSWRPPEIAGTIGRPAGRTAVTAERVPIFYSESPLSPLSPPPSTCPPLPRRPYNL